MTSFLASEEAMPSEYWIERGENWAEWLVSHSGWIQGPGNRAIGQTDRDHPWQACALSVTDGDRMTDGSHCERRGMRWRFPKAPVFPGLPADNGLQAGLCVLSVGQ